MRQYQTRILCLLCLCALCFFLLLSSLIVGGFKGNALFPVDCAIVFGAATDEQQGMGPGIKRRVATAVKLLDEGKVSRLFMTGGKGRLNVSTEAAIMRQYALDLGVHSSQIFIEQEATSTWENLLYTRPLVNNADCQSFVAISDRFHLSRIQSMAKVQKWPYITMYPSQFSIPLYSEVYSVIREVFAYIYNSKNLLLH